MVHWAVIDGGLIEKQLGLNEKERLICFEECIELGERSWLESIPPVGFVSAETAQTLCPFYSQLDLI